MAEPHTEANSTQLITAPYDSQYGIIWAIGSMGKFGQPGHLATLTGETVWSRMSAA